LISATPFSGFSRPFLWTVLSALTGSSSLVPAAGVCARNLQLVLFGLLVLVVSRAFRVLQVSPAFLDPLMLLGFLVLLGLLGPLALLSFWLASLPLPGLLGLLDWLELLVWLPLIQGTQLLHLLGQPDFLALLAFGASHASPAVLGPPALLAFLVLLGLGPLSTAVHSPWRWFLPPTRQPYAP